MNALITVASLLLFACQSTYKQGFLTVDEIQGVFNNSVSLATVRTPDGEISMQQLSFSPGTGTILLSEAAKVGAAATFGVAAAPLYKPSQYKTNSTVNNGNSNNAVSQGSVAKSTSQGGVGLGGIGVGGSSVSGANSTAQGGAATAEGGAANAVATQNTEVRQGQFQSQEQYQGQYQDNAGHRDEDDKK
jgi:hypothetical protein